MSEQPVIQVDIVSDVVCPWCIVGFKKLEKALHETGTMAALVWHPFELNPDMPPEGENLREHIMRKYGSTPEQSVLARQRLQQIGEEVGFAFHFSDDSRIVNTFLAHQLLDWAYDQDGQHALALTLFHLYFGEGLDVSDPNILLKAVEIAGLDPEAAREVLVSQSHAGQVRAKQKVWIERGITGVPAMIIGRKYLLVGAQEPSTYVTAIRRVLEEEAA